MNFAKVWRGPELTMNGLSYLLSTLGTQQQPLKVHHSRASGSDAVEMSPDFSRVTSAHNIYPIST